jgi:N-formylmaleamate deformylase
MTAVERTPARGTSRYIAAGDLRLHVLEYAGDGPAVVIVPGITSPAISWEFVAEQLAPDYHVFALDNRGRGLSDHPESGYALRDYADDLAAVIEGLGLERPALIGHSMGARIVTVLAATRPELAGPLVVADPPMSGPGRDPYPMTEEQFRQQLRDVNAGTVTLDDIRRSYPRWDDEACRLRIEWLGTCSEVAVVESHRSFESEDIVPYLRQLQPPALFLYGGESPMVTAESVREVAAANPRLELAGVAGAGHMLPWDELQGFLEPVREFLARTA